MRHPPQRPRWAPKVNFLLRRQKFDSLTPPNPPRTLPVHDVIHIPSVTFTIWDFYFDISEWHILPACAWTPELMLHLTNPCAKRKVLSLTKPKGKLYKTKSLGHYFTQSFTNSHIYMYREDLALNKGQKLICSEKTNQPTNKPILGPKFL